MSPISGAMSSMTSGFPRVSGDEHPRLDVTHQYRVFSPRERG